MACEAEFEPQPFRYTCDKCGENLDAVYDYQAIARTWHPDDLRHNRDRSLWRYLPLLPVAKAPSDRSIIAGGTPLVELPRIADDYGISRFTVKDDTRNPSGSLKDRASEVGIRHAIEQGHRRIVVASTGNAAASLSCLSAFYGVTAVILAPASAPPAKLTQIIQYGATLLPVDGTYDNTFDLALEVTREFGWYSRSTGVNPVMSEGKKTVALEIAEQYEWNPPDYVFVSVGDGCIIGGVYKGFYDLYRLGWIPHIPKIIAVQAEGSSAIVRALQGDGVIRPVSATTRADSISVDLPRDGLKALRAVNDSDGFGILVSDDEILNAQWELSRKSGIFSEPAGACAFAGFTKAVREDLLPSRSSVCTLITGSGLKDIPAARMKIVIPEKIPATMEGFRGRMGL